MSNQTFIELFNKGKESGAQGSVPHIHYYFNKNGTSRKDFVKMIKKGIIRVQRCIYH